MTETSMCDFCDTEAFRQEMVYLDNDFCFYASSRFDHEVDILPGAGIIVPKAHRATAFELTAAEWAATFELLGRVREVIDQQLAPDGYLIGWNCGPAARRLAMRIYTSSHALRTSHTPVAACDGYSASQRTCDPSRSGRETAWQQSRHHASHKNSLRLSRKQGSWPAAGSQRIPVPRRSRRVRAHTLPVPSRPTTWLPQPRR